MIRRWVSVFDWVPRYRRADFPADLVAGLTGAAVIVPQSMAYAQLARVPPVVGLYVSVVPLLVYAVLGRVGQLGMGPLATISVLSAAGVAKLAPEGTAEFVALSATIAVLVGVFHLVIGLGRLGFLVRFLSEPVMSGFLSGAGVVIIATQLGPISGIGVEANSTSVLDIVRDWAASLDEASVVTLVVGGVTLAVLIAARHWPRIPSQLVAVVVSSVVVAVSALEEHGLAVVGKVPSGLALPEVPEWSLHDVRVLAPTALAITLISILESLSLAREFAEEHRYEIDANQEIAAVGASNVAAGVFQGIVVTGAISRSSILNQTGARTQLTGVICALIVAPLVMFASGAFQDIPIAVLSAIVISAVLSFVKVGEARRLWRVQRSDFWVMAIAFAGTMVFGLEVGVLLAVALSIGLIVYRVARPHLPELGRLEGSDAFVELDGRHEGATTFPATIVLRVETALYFTNAPVLANRLRELEGERPDLQTIVLDASGVNFLDATADHALRKLAARYRERGTRLLLVNVEDRVRAVMDASGFTELVGEDAFFPSDAAALAYLRTGT